MCDVRVSPAELKYYSFLGRSTAVNCAILEDTEKLPEQP